MQRSPEEIAKEKEMLDYYFSLTPSSNVLYWAEKEFQWKPLSGVDKDGNTKIAWYQYLMLGCCDDLYYYPDDFENEQLRGKKIRKFVWRIGRQSGKSSVCALSSLYLALNKPIKFNNVQFGKEIPCVRGASIIVASADADKAKTVFERVESFLLSSPKFCKAIEERRIVMKMSPYPEIKFYIDGWTKPAYITFRGPGKDGNSTRSKTYDYKIYDEADYMPKEFFETEQATGINAGDNALVILSSTPTGKVDGYFYEACTKKGLGFLEIHAASHENPRYTEEFDRHARLTQPEIIYQHEYLAEWGTVEEGVFDWTHFEWVFREQHTYKDPRTNEERIIPIYRTHNQESQDPKLQPDEYEKITLNSDLVLNKIGLPNLQKYLKDRFPPKEGNCIYYSGADFGYSDDATELVVFKERNGVMKMILRIHIEHVSQHVLCEIIALLDSHYQFTAMGMDVGNFGQMIDNVLKGQGGENADRYKNHNFTKRLHSVNFSQIITVTDTHTKVSKNYHVKQFMTDCIIVAAQNKMLIMPSIALDKNLVEQFRNHTYKVNATGRIVYSKNKEDHCLDAIRTVFWAKSQLKQKTQYKYTPGSTVVSRSRSGGAWR